MNHRDAKQVLVQSELDEEIFMKFPLGCGKEPENVLVLDLVLDLSLHGLKQAGST